MIIKKFQFYLIILLLLFSQQSPVHAQTSEQPISRGGEPVYVQYLRSDFNGYPVDLTSNGTHLFIINTVGSITLISLSGKYYGPLNNLTSGPNIYGSTGIVYANNLLYVVSNKLNQTFIFKTNGDYVGKFGTTGSGNGQFEQPYFIAADSSYLYIVDRLNYRIQVFDFNGTYVRQFGSYGTEPNQFTNIWGIAVMKDKLYVCDQNSRSIKVFSTSGNFLFSIKYPGSLTNPLMNPFGIATSSNFIYVTELNSKNIYVFDLNGNYQTQFTEPGYLAVFDTTMFVANNQLFVPDPASQLIAEYDLLSPPRDIKTFQGDTSITISWKDPQHEDHIPIKSYILYRSTDGKNFDYYVETKNNYYVDQAVLQGTTYYYKVAAVAINSSVGISDFSTISGMKFDIIFSTTSSNSGFLPINQTAALLGLFVTFVIIRYKNKRKKQFKK